MKYLLVEHYFESDTSLHNEKELVMLAEQYSKDTHYDDSQPRIAIEDLKSAIDFFNNRSFTVIPLEKYSDKDIAFIQSQNLQNGRPLNRVYKCLVCGNYHYSDYELKSTCYDVYSGEKYIGTICGECFESHEDREIAEIIHTNHKIKEPIQFDMYEETTVYKAKHVARNKIRKEQKIC